ncbi:response regulator [Neptunomonas sp.]|uniref:response regulator n=1 Tax=Neptunomonas sp. TaxID=1971898 RepID=UPI00356B09F3
MLNASRFSILLMTDAVEDLRSLSNLIKRHFARFYIAKNEEEALSIILDKKIDVLLMGLKNLRENEACFLHLLSSNKNVDKILSRRILLCSREELKDAFSICNKDVFDDYFIVRPLYDPYHILLRLRFLRRVKNNRDSRDMNAVNLDDLCSYFDQVMNSQDVLDEVNQDSYEKLLTIVSFSMEKMKQNILKNSTLPKEQQKQISSIIDHHAESELIKEVSAHQKSTQQQLHAAVKDVTDIAQLKKDRLEHPKADAFPDSNILLIENDALMRDNIKENLESAGYSAQVSGGATHAIQLMRTWKPDIVMIDVKLPDMSPLYVINTIKNDSGMRHTRILLLATEGDKENTQEAMKLGVHGVLRKPVDRDMLIYKINYNLNLLKASG